MKVEAAVYRVKTGKPMEIAFRILERDKPALTELFKTGDSFLMILATPFRKRSTGANSQNRRINGFIQQIAQFTGMPFSGLKEYCKAEAVGEGYPFVTLPNGAVIGKSEAEISVEEAVILSGTIERIAAEWGIELRE
jgi:hypothetical protein